MKSIRSIFRAAAIVLGTLILHGCGGGADSSPASVVNASQRSTSGQLHMLATRWVPVASDIWQWQLRGTLNTSYNVKIYDVDLFNTDPATFAKLKNDGRKIVCYFSAGSSEDWRPDYSQFKAAEIGEAMEGWVGENWLDIRSDNVRKIMSARLDLAVRNGCDGVEPDNVDGYANPTGFPLTAQDQINFNSFLATQAHDRNLAVALKNDVDQLADLQPLFDFAVNEQCNEKTECAAYNVFTSANKPVLNAEYSDDYHDGAAQQDLCASSRAANIRTLVLALELDDSYRFSCD